MKAFRVVCSPNLEFTMVEIEGEDYEEAANSINEIVGYPNIANARVHEGCLTVYDTSEGKDVYFTERDNKVVLIGDGCEVLVWDKSIVLKNFYIKENLLDFTFLNF